MDELVHAATFDGVTTITLDSPANRNALSAQVRRELTGRLDAAIGDAGVRVIVLTHTGPVISRRHGSCFASHRTAIRPWPMPMQELSARHFASPEDQEGMAAFAERRPPAWATSHNDG